MFSRLLLLWIWLYSSAGGQEYSNSKICQSRGFNSDLGDFNCSNLQLNWSDLHTVLIDPTWSATNLNLAFNNFSSSIANKSFNLFKMLDDTLNLTSNNLNHIESHAFFYSLEAEPIDLVPLKITRLDLSHNQFELLPWNSIKLLGTLETVYFSGNSKLKRLDSGDLIESDYSKYFSSLKYIYLNGCQIDHVNPIILKHFISLEYLDLSSNRLRSLDAQVGMSLTRFGQFKVKINLANNQLQCNCKLQWLKTYLIKTNFNSLEQKCQISYNLRSVNSEPQLIGTKLIDLAEEASEQNLEIKEMIQSNSGEETRDIANTSIVLLDDNKFICDMEFVEPDSWFKMKTTETVYDIELKCKVRGYPLPIIRWNEDNKLVIKKSSFYKFEIEERITHPSPEDQEYIVESVLKLRIQSFHSSKYKNFTCRVKLNSSIEKDLHNEKKLDKDLAQKMYLFRIHHENDDDDDDDVTGYTLPDIFNIESQYDSSSFNKDYVKKREKPFVYWIILVACILFTLMVILFATICIVRNNHKNVKLEEQLRYFSHSNYSVNKRIYLNNVSTATRDLNSSKFDALQPLKPDNIREHQDYSSIYMNNTSSVNKSPSRYSMPYSNVYFDTPTSLKGTNDFLLSPDDQHQNQSFDQSPVDISHIEQDNSSCSSKFYEENIEEYQDPEFDDLRKPVEKNKIKKNDSPKNDKAQKV